jgi:hypothetical protein
MRNELLLSALLGLSLLHCSGSDKKAPKYPDTTEFCKGWAEAQCWDMVVDTCVASSKETCISNRQSVCTADLVTPALNAQLTYDSSNAEGCVDAVRNAYSDAKITNTDEKAMTEACELVFSGTETQGAACSKDADCKQSKGLKCVVHYATSTSDGGTAEGTCQVPSPTPVAGGASCSEPEQQCAVGYHCGTSSHCDQDEPKDASCSSQDPCAEGYKCASDKCVEKLAQGSTCTADDQCLSGYCVETVNLCATTYQLAPSEPFCKPMHN